MSLTAPFTRAGPPVLPSDALSDMAANRLIRVAQTEPVTQQRIDAVVRLYKAGIEPPRREEWRSEMVTMPLLAGAGL